MRVPLDRVTFCTLRNDAVPGWDARESPYTFTSTRFCPTRPPHRSDSGLESGLGDHGARGCAYISRLCGFLSVLDELLRKPWKGDVVVLFIL